MTPSVSTETTETTNENLFASYGLSTAILSALSDMKFLSPTPIQQQALPKLLGKATDFLGLASTGTGKTGAFGIPLAEQIDTTKKDTQALVLCPTRELALQVAGQLEQLGSHKGIRVVTIYGGASYRPQIEGIRRGAHIIVGTPGRLVDMIDQGYVKLNQIKTLVLDEADEMISLGFKDDLETILKATHNPEIKCNTWLFSATMNTEVRRVANNYLKNPEQVQINKSESALTTIEQIYYTVQDKNKLEVIARILGANDNFYGIIFCQTKQQVAAVTELLQKRGLYVDCLHGDRSQRERETILNKFRERDLTVIVATDVAARGLDVKDLTHVINYNLPRELDTYTHRIGRTGRAGQSGIAISLISPDQLRLLKRVMMSTKAKMTKGKIPGLRDIAKQQLTKTMDILAKMGEDSQRVRMAERVLSEMEDHPLLKSDISAREMLARMLALSHADVMIDDGRQLDYIGEGRTPRELDEASSGRGGSGARSASSGYERRERSDRGGRSYDRSERGGGYERRERSSDRGDRYERSDRPARSAERNDRTERSDRPVRSDRAEFGSKPARRSYKAASEFGEEGSSSERSFRKKSYSETKSFGDKKTYGDKKSFGDKKPFAKKPFTKSSSYKSKFQD